MEKYSEDEEKLRNNIFEIFSKYHNEAISDRRQVYIALFYDSLGKWCKNILRYKNVEDMGSEIYRVAWRIIIKEKLLKNKDDFFKYLNKSLKRAKSEYYKNLNTIRIPRELYKLNTLEEVLIMKEKQLCRLLTDKERNKWIRIWTNIENLKNIKSLSYDVSDDQFSNELNEKDIIDEKTEKIIEAINHYFIKRQDRNRDCYRALFTVDCIRKKVYFKALYNILDKNIIDEWQNNNIKPELYATYQKYHQVPKESANSRTSNILDEINKTLNKYLVKKYPKLFT